MDVPKTEHSCGHLLEKDLLEDISQRKVRPINPHAQRLLAAKLGKPIQPRRKPNRRPHLLQRPSQPPKKSKSSRVTVVTIITRVRNPPKRKLRNLPMAGTNHRQPAQSICKLFLGKKHLGIHATFIACCPCHCMENAKQFVLV